MRIAIFPGSFDPVTLGHVEIIERGAAIFDKVIVALGTNSKKQYRFTEAQRMEMLHIAFADVAGVEVQSYEGLTVKFAEQNGAKFLLRGIRSAADLAYEQPTSLINKHLAPGMETIYLHSFPETQHISSTIVREVIRYDGKLQGLVPEGVAEYVEGLKGATGVENA
ncbi:MAG: pantetheine-phosphate adenylyltransferase [Bacteroidia bacterium]